MKEFFVRANILSRNIYSGADDGIDELVKYGTSLIIFNSYHNHEIGSQMM